MLRMPLRKMKKAYTVTLGHYVHLSDLYNPSNSKNIKKGVNLHQKKTSKDIKCVFAKDLSPVEAKKIEGDFTQHIGLYDIFTKSFTHIYSRKFSKNDPERQLQCQRIINQAFGVDDESYNEQNSTVQPNFAQEACSSQTTGTRTDNETLKLISNINEISSENQKVITKDYKDAAEIGTSKKLEERAQDIVSRIFPTTTDEAYNDQNVENHPNLPGHVISSTVHCNKNTDNGPEKMTINDQSLGEKQEIYSTIKCNTTEADQSTKLVDYKICSTSEKMTVSYNENCPNLAHLVSSTMQSNLGSENKSHGDKTSAKTPTNDSKQDTTPALKLSTNTGTDLSKKIEERAKDIVSKIFSPITENVTNDHINLVNVSSSGDTDKVTDNGQSLGEHIELRAQDILSKVFSTSDKNVVENPNLETLGDPVKLTDKDEILKNHVDFTDLPTSSVVSYKETEDIIIENDAKFDVPEEKEASSSAEQYDDTTKSDKHYIMDKDTQRALEIVSLVFSTTTKQNDEEVNQKVEHVNEPDVVVDKSPPNEGFNITPRVLGDENPGNITAPAQFEDVTNKASSATHVDEYVLRYIERMNGVPLETTYNNDIDSEDCELIKPDHIQNAHRYADKLYYEYIGDAKTEMPEPEPETVIPELLILEPLLMREPLLPSTENNPEESYLHVIQNDFEEELPLKEIEKPSDDNKIDEQREEIVLCASEKANQEENLAFINDAQNLQPMVDCEGFLEYTPYQDSQNVSLSCVSDATRDVSLTCATKTFDLEANTSENKQQDTNLVTTNESFNVIQDISQSQTITSSPKEDMYDFANMLSIEVEREPPKTPVCKETEPTGMTSKSGKVDEIVLGLGVMVDSPGRPRIRIRKRRDVRAESRILKRKRRIVEDENKPEIITMRLSEILGPLPTLEEQLPLSELLNRVRKRNKIQQIHNTLQSLLVNQPTMIKIKRSPTAPRSPPANPVPPLPPGPPPLKQKPPACKPKRPKKTTSTAFIPLALLKYSPFIPMSTSAVHNSLNQLPNKANLLQEIRERIAMIKNFIPQTDSNEQINSKDKLSNSVVLARNPYDPWTPIPCWPQPRRPKKRKLICPKQGCPFPPPRIMKDPDPPAKPHSCKGLPKKHFSGPTIAPELGPWWPLTDLVFFGMFLLSQLLM